MEYGCPFPFLFPFLSLSLFPFLFLFLVLCPYLFPSPFLGLCLSLFTVLAIIPTLNPCWLKCWKSFELKPRFWACLSVFGKGCGALFLLKLPAKLGGLGSSKYWSICLFIGAQALYWNLWTNTSVPLFPFLLGSAFKKRAFRLLEARSLSLALFAMSLALRKTKKPVFCAELSAVRRLNIVGRSNWALPVSFCCKTPLFRAKSCEVR